MIELHIHRPPMTGIIHAVVRRYALHTALEALNEEWKTDYTEADVVHWGHITQEDAIKHAEMIKRGGMLNSDTNLK